MTTLIDAPAEVDEAISAPEAPDAAATPPPKRPRRPLKPLKTPNFKPRPPVVKDTRWWVGVVWLCVTVLITTLVMHLTLFSGMQHSRAQTLGYAELRQTLAKAETPVGQLNFDDQVIPIGTPLALIEAPAIGLREVIFEGTTADSMRQGPGHRRDTVLPGQSGTSVIMGKQTTYGGPFNRLSELGMGDKITVTTGQGVNTYEVFGLRRDGDPLPAPLTKGSGRLELITANGLALFPSGGLYLDANLTSEVRETPGRVFTAAALPATEIAMGTDAAGASNLILSLILLGVSIAAIVWAWRRWGKWQTWVVGVPLIVVCTSFASDAVAAMLPNLL